MCEFINGVLLDCFRFARGIGDDAVLIGLGPGADREQENKKENGSFHTRKISKTKAINSGGRFCFPGMLFLSLPR